MTTYAGRTQPLLITPDNGQGDGFGPSFTTSPFEMRDAVIAQSQGAGFNLIRWDSASASILGNAGPIGGAPQQFGVDAPNQFQLGPFNQPYFLRYVADFGPDAFNTNFFTFDTLLPIITGRSFGNSNPGVGVTLVDNVIIEGWSFDGVTILARARYEIRLTGL